ncbi:ADP-ribosylglycohydrolase family protein [Bradyrhizobium sp. AS23.2]|uniref:ADP-ribosylglycohydrolase family protein n=1 Tax=Bradyrhizobium sp. AS23.2 TaxID=1680155 RepID=UPI000A8390AB|nr:ADP-ribosylglycohydrolase family protein [Bradyrhizobium sp. AS23.2]
MTFPPRSAVFWFIAEPGAEPKPSRMAGYFSKLPSNLDLLPDRYFNVPLYNDEIWPGVRAAYDFIGYRDETYFPGGSVGVRPDGTASYFIDPQLNTKAFLDVIAAQTGTSAAKARVTLKDKRAIGRVGPPLTEDCDAHVEFGSSTDERAKPKLGPLIEDRAYGAMLGLAVGDALGVPLEFSERDTRPHVSEMIGGGPFSLKPGEWTDDTSMALCLADSLIANNKLDEIDLLNRFVRWWKQGENSVNGNCFDIGITTRHALDRFIRLGTPAGSGPHNKDHAGNGSLMRLAPVAIFATSDVSEAVRLAHRQSMTTHANAVAAKACEFFATLLVEAMRGLDKDTVLRSRFWFSHDELNGIAAGNWVGKTRDEISSSGYVIATLEAALWCVHRTSSFEEAVILAVNLGHDSDTVAAVTGQLAGALYGRAGIPQRWLEKLVSRKQIEDRVAPLLRAGRQARKTAAQS